MDQTKTLTKTQTNKTYVIPNTMYPRRDTPLSAHEINSTNHKVNDLLKRAVSNAYRHGLNLKLGKLNSANGNCVWEPIIYTTYYIGNVLRIKQRKLVNNYELEA